MSASTATSPNSTRRAEREISLSWDTADSLGIRRLRAECDDERTEMLFVGRPVFDESDPQTLLTGPLGAMLVAEHQARCDACQAWAKQAS